MPRLLNAPREPAFKGGFNERLVLSHLARRSGHKQHAPIVEEKTDGHAKKEFESFFKEIAANLKASNVKKQDNDNQADEPPETKSDDKPPRSSEEQ